MRILFVLSTVLALSLELPARSATALPAGLLPSPETVRYTTPAPPYPRVAMGSRIDGEGTVQVTFGQRGNVTQAQMVKSTGSIILDHSTLEFVKQYWKSSGGTRTTRTVAIVYRMPVPPKEKETAVVDETFDRKLFVTPHPPYPLNARVRRISGTITVSVLFGANKGPVQVKILKSSGDAVLDGYTADYIRLFWRYLGNKPVEHTTTLEYYIR